MNGTSRPRQAVNIVMAVIAPGSDYSIAYRRGARIGLEFAPSSERVVVTRGRGRVVIGYVVGAEAAAVAARLKESGRKLIGQIDGVSLGPQGKLLRIRLD